MSAGCCRFGSIIFSSGLSHISLILFLFAYLLNNTNHRKYYRKQNHKVRNTGHKPDAQILCTLRNGSQTVFKTIQHLLSDVFEGFDKMQELDIVEAYIMVEVPR